MYDIITYSSESKVQWDNFVASSRNGTFLFLRDYMDYHADRFTDSSFLFLRKNKLVAILPGNINGTTYHSHQGLTYGGMMLKNEIGTTEVMELFQLLNQHLKTTGIREVVYKAIPHIYQQIPSQEDIYALFRMNAAKTACTISSAIYKNNKIKFIESRKSGIRKSLREHVIIRESLNFKDFWSILDSNLMERYQTKTTHSADEIILLSERFPDKIRLFTAVKDDKIIAGTVLYIMGDVVHVQYMSASPEGKAIGALDLLFDQLINNTLISFSILDFGHSNENGGIYLNENLIFQKKVSVVGELLTKLIPFQFYEIKQWLYYRCLS